MNQPINNTNEEEITAKIIALKGQGLGFRRISQELTTKGFKVNKDRCNKLFNKHEQANKKEKSAVTDKELMVLQAQEAKQLQRLQIAKEKQEIKTRLIEIYAEKATLTFERRMQLFDLPEDLLRLAWKIMPATYPALWSEFTVYCEQRDLDQAGELAKSVGPQEEYERQRDLLEKKSFVTYLAKKIVQYLSYLRLQTRSEMETGNIDGIEGQKEELEELNLVFF